MVDTDVKDYVDLKLGTAQAQLGMAQAHNEAQFAVILQRLDSIQDSMPTKWAMFATAASAVVAVSGVFIAVMAFGGDRFDSGMSVASVSIQDAVEAREDAIEAKEDAIEAKEDAITAREIATRNTEEMQSIQADLDAILTLLSEQARR